MLQYTLIFCRQILNHVKMLVGATAKFIEVSPSDTAHNILYRSKALFKAIPYNIMVRSIQCYTILGVV